MKAVRFHEHGEPSVLRYEEAPEPKIGPAEVLVRVRACALNHLDMQVRRGQFGRSPHLPHILGADIAGVVEQVGTLITHVKPGD
ncbi:MAG: alcohol dehydrogenase catalytic domain-containing protein, partial [Chloroflexi bacterium]|nr:alcohol dehydrogenase catalytic domain-containing protein [Chloroflexota bacterium]